MTNFFLNIFVTMLPSNKQQGVLGIVLLMLYLIAGY